MSETTDKSSMKNISQSNYKFNSLGIASSSLLH